VGEHMDRTCRGDGLRPRHSAGSLRVGTDMSGMLRLVLGRTRTEIEVPQGLREIRSTGRRRHNPVSRISDHAKLSSFVEVAVASLW
jgi:hypothetical protein